MNIESLIFLTFEKCRIIFFKEYRKYFINNEKRLKYNNINKNVIYSRYYINFEIKMRIENEKEVIILKEVYLIFNLFCDLIIDTNILKLNNIMI